MSADNWTTCPKCHSEKVVDKEVQRLKAAACYGKVNPSEYLRMVQVAEAPIEEKQTLREDYELGTQKNGLFYVIYRCSCLDCGFKFEFKHNADLKEMSDKTG